MIVVNSTEAAPSVQLVEIVVRDPEGDLRTFASLAALREAYPGVRLE